MKLSIFQLIGYSILGIFIFYIVGSLIIGTFDNLEKLLSKIPWYLYVVILIIVFSIIKQNNKDEDSKNDKTLKNNFKQKSKRDPFVNIRNQASSAKTSKKAMSIYDLVTDDMVRIDLFEKAEQLSNVYIENHLTATDVEQIFNSSRSKDLKSELILESKLHDFGFINLPKAFFADPKLFIAHVVDSCGEFVRKTFVYECLSSKIVPSPEYIRSFSICEINKPNIKGVIIQFPPKKEIKIGYETHTFSSWPHFAGLVEGKGCHKFYLLHNSVGISNSQVIEIDKNQVKTNTEISCLFILEDFKDAIAALTEQSKS